MSKKTIFYDPNFGRTYSGTGNTFRTPEGHFGIVGKNGKVHYPAPARATPPLSRVAPPANLSKRYGNDVRRGTTIDMKPDGSYKILGSRRGVSLPGYVKPVKYNPRGVNAVARAGAHLGMRALRGHPVGRMINLGFDAANMLTSEWAYGPETTFEDSLKAAGFEATCHTGDGTGYYRLLECTRYASGGIYCSVGCRIWGQIPSGQDSDTIELKALPPPGASRRHITNIFVGSGWGVSPLWRMDYEKMYARVEAYGAARPRLVIKKTRNAIQLPASVPPVASISESSTTPPRSRLRTPPYSLPAVEASFGGARVPPRLTNHVLAPFGGRERKGNVGRSTGLALIAKLYDATTEAKEIVDILYDNLGKKCKGARSMSAKANCVYRNIGTLNVAKAMAEIAKNHYEDKVYGRVFGTVGKNTKFGSMLPGTGPTRSAPTVKKR